VWEVENETGVLSLLCDRGLRLIARLQIYKNAAARDAGFMGCATSQESRVRIDFLIRQAWSGFLKAIARHAFPIHFYDLLMFSMLISIRLMYAQ